MLFSGCNFARGCLAAALAGGALASLAAGSPPAVFSGAVAGVLTPTDLPAVRWRLEGGTGADDRGNLVLAAEADGLSANVTVSLDARTGEGTWEMRDGSLDLAVWLPALAGRFNLGALKTVSVTGRLRLAGRGTVRGGRPDGEITATLRDGTLSESGSGLTVDGLTADLHLTGLVPPLAPGAQTVTFTQARIGGLTLGNGNLTVALPAADTVRVMVAGVDVLGGRVELEPFPLILPVTVADVRARFRRIDLAAIEPLLPTGGITGAQGRLGGLVALHWSAADGFGVGDVRFDVGRGDAEPTFRLAPVPGLLTSKVPEKIALLPGWLAAPAENPVYVSMREIELGRTTLRVDALRLRLNPAGDTQNRTVQIDLQATPVGPSTVGRVNFDLGVAGPLDELLKFILNKKLSVPKP